MRAFVAVVSALASAEALAAPCEAVPVLDRGRQVGAVCPEDAPRDGLTLVDLSDDWVPAMLRGHPYAPTYVALAAEDEEADVRGDRYFELYGVPPALRVVGARLVDDARHVCHALAPRSATARTSGRLWIPQLPAPVVLELGRRMTCERLLRGMHQSRWRVEEALERYQRLHGVASRGVLDRETRRVLLASTEELDFRALLRALRARVIDATGLIEDGSALSARGLVVGRAIDGDSAYAGVGRPPAARGAPDLVAQATDATARALGWTDPARAAAFFRHPLPARMRVAVRLPPVPAYHSLHMDLRAEIDRGDVWYALPGRRGRVALPPVITLYARTAAGHEIALVRWPTTIGGWKRELTPWGGVALRFKDSDVGRRVWRDLVVMPAWLPPPKTPPRTLVRSVEGRRWAADTSLVAPGYASAYGMVMLVHHEALLRRGRFELVDRGIRTHGTVSYESIGRGESHGCHRLSNASAVALGSFLLRHRLHMDHGLVDKPYLRLVPWRGRLYKLPIPHRGARYELLPPVPVEVLAGTIRGPKRRPPVRMVALPTGR